MRSRKQVVTGYVEFVAACRVMGVAHLLKDGGGNAPSIERMIRAHNARVRASKQKVVDLPYPPLADMIAAKEQDFRRGLLSDDLRDHVTKWSLRKREELANG